MHSLFLSHQVQKKIPSQKKFLTCRKNSLGQSASTTSSQLYLKRSQMATTDRHPVPPVQKEPCFLSAIKISIFGGQDILLSDLR